MNKLHPHTEPKLKVATSVVRKEKGEGPLFYILPPLLVVAVFAFCALSGSPTPVREAASQGEAAVAAPAGESAPQSPSSAGNEAVAGDASEETGVPSSAENASEESASPEAPMPEDGAAEDASQGAPAAEAASDGVAPQEPTAAVEETGAEG